MNIQTCRNCQQVFKLKKTPGKPSAFCSPACKEMFKKQYHKEYDAQPDQLARRRDYMTKYREDGRQKRKSTLMRDQPRTKAKAWSKIKARKKKTKELIENHENARRVGEEWLWEPPEPGELSP